jgi:hypothetical protein
MLFTKLPLLASFSHDYGLIIADVEHHVNHVSVGTLGSEGNLEDTVMDLDHIHRQGVQPRYGQSA